MDITKSLATERREPVDAVKSAHSAQGDSLLDGTANRFKVAFKEKSSRRSSLNQSRSTSDESMGLNANKSYDYDAES